MVVIPARNEEAMIGKVVARAQQQAGVHVVVVDNNSEDKTAREARKAGAEVLFAAKKGKGRAARIGCDYAFQQGAKYIILLDGDGQHPPEFIPAIKRALAKNDVVSGRREHRSSFPLKKRVGRKLIDTALFLLFNIRTTDSICGYKGFTAKSYRKIRWNTDNYNLEVEMVLREQTYKLKKARMNIPTIDASGKQSYTIKAGVGTLLQLLYWYVFGLKKNHN